MLSIALIAFLLGFKARRKASKSPSYTTQPEREVFEHKAELHGNDRQAAELEGSGITQWWSKRFKGSLRVKALNDTAPLELPAEDVKWLRYAQQKKVRNEDLDEYRPV